MAKKYIDAEELKTAFPSCDNSKPVLVSCVRRTINHMPAANVVEVVRCKDCIFYKTGRMNGIDYELCVRRDDSFFNEADGFCKWGERRTDGEVH